MKYIITESQSDIYYFLRRIHGHIPLMREIIVEGFDIYDHCDLTFDEFLKKILNGSAETLLLSYFELYKMNPVKRKILVDFVEDFMYTRFHGMIKKYYYEYEPC
jgi:hypothetical protein